MLLDRMGLSIKNEWYNDDGRVYIYYTIKEICDNLDREAGKRFDELISCHNTIVNTMSYENFRTGFQLGVMMVMEAVNENDATFFEL